MRRVRALLHSDIGVLHDLWKEYCEETGGESTPEHFMLALRNMLSVPGYTFLILEVDGEPVGFTDFFPASQPFYPYMVMVSKYSYVRPEHRGNSGLLFRPMIRAAKAAGIKEIQIACKDNMVGFWERHKFKVVSHVMTRRVK